MAKILHIYKSFLPVCIGGVARAIDELATGAVAQGHDVTVFALSKNPERSTRLTADKPYSVVFAKETMAVASNPLSSEAYRLLNRIVDQYDIINLHYPWPFGDLLLYMARPRGKIVVTYHSDIVAQKKLERLYAPLRKWVLNKSSMIVATSEEYRNSSPLLNQYRHKTATVPLGLTEVERPDPALVEKWREQVGEGFSLFLGFFRYYKGLPYLIEAAKKTRLPLVMAGAGALHDQIAEQVKKEGLDNIKLTGRVSEEDKHALMSLAGSFVFPSHVRAEAYGLSMVEAAMHGLPLISCAIQTGTSFVNRDGITGLEIEAANSDALADAMRKIHAFPELRQRMGAASRAHYEAELSSARMVERYEAVYGQVLAQRAGVENLIALPSARTATSA